VRYADLLARVTGLCVAVAGAALAGRELVGPATDGVRSVGVAASEPLSVPAAATVGVGVAFVLAGLAVLADRGRAVAVSVGGAGAAAAVAGVAVGTGSTVGTLGVGATGVALLLSGAGTRGRSDRSG